MKDDDVDRLDPARQKLLAAKVGPLLTWTSPEIAPTVGPHDPDLFVPFDTRQCQIIRELKVRLHGFREEQIQTLLGDRTSDDAELVGTWRSFLAAEIERLRTNIPPWYIGGFGHPDHQADFEYWTKMAHFELTELACLSIGIDPTSFRPEDYLAWGKIASDRLSPPIRFLMQRREQLKRRFGAGSRWSVHPREFFEWADSVDFDAHPEFMRLLRRYHQSRSQEAGAEAPRPDKREIDKIAQLFTAIAIEEYGYDPEQKRSPIPREIADIASRMGLTVTDETVLKYLRIGAGFLPDGWRDR